MRSLIQLMVFVIVVGYILENRKSVLRDLGQGFIHFGKYLREIGG